MVSAPTTYGQLMLRAAFGIQHGLARVQVAPLDSRVEAEQTIQDYRDVLRALTGHAYTLLERRRLPGITTSATPDPRERAAVRMADHLHDLVGPRPVPPVDVARLATSPWVEAAVAVRAASELVATHTDHAGLGRTPDLQLVLREPSARQAGLAQVGDLAATLLVGTDHLALRATQAGIPWGQVRDLLPDPGEARPYARDVAGAGSLPVSLRLDDLTVARPEIRRESAPVEIADRLLRLRRAAWEQAHSDHPSVDDLKAFATLGVAVHAHALAIHGHPPLMLPAVPPTEPAIKALLTRGRAWQDIARGIFAWRSAQPSDPVVHGDLVSITTRLRAVAPLTGGEPELDVAERRQLAQVLDGAAQVLADVARWNGTTAARMGRTNQVYVQAATLTGDQVTDDAALINAKLNGAHVPVPPENLADVGRRYAATGPESHSAAHGAEGILLRSAPLMGLPCERGHAPIGRVSPGEA